MFQSALKGASVVAALLVSTAAHAELTADQIWSNWKTMYGSVLSAGSETREGDTLILRTVTTTSAFEGGSFTGSIETISLREPGDGTVEITMSPDYKILLRFSDAETGEIVVDAGLRQPDLRMVASGSEAEIRYDFSMPSASAVLNSLTVDGKPIEAVFSADMTAATGNSMFTQGAPRRFASTIAVDGARMFYSFADPETRAKTEATYNLKDLGVTTSGTILDAVLMEDVAQALADGLKFDMSISTGFAESTSSIIGPEGTTEFKATNDSSTGTIGFGQDGLAFKSAGTGIVYAMSSASAAMPPMQASAREMDIDLRMPIAKSDEPGDFALKLNLGDVELSEDVWGLFDPQKVLPRDPASMVIDTKGKMNWLVNIFDDEQTAALKPGDSPVALQALEIPQVLLRAAGAEVTGTGAFTFDNSDTTTFPGMPMPTGQLDLKIVGTNGLLDRLVQMGLLPEDQAMGARMMMGLFAKTVEGSDDTLTSTLEFKDKGFFANGQRLQ